MTSLHRMLLGLASLSFLFASVACSPGRPGAGLAPPDPVGVGETGDADVLLQWTDPNGGEAAYLVERRAEGEQAAVERGRTARGAQSFRDTDLVRGVTYLYSVRALAPSGELSAPSGEVRVEGGSQVRLVPPAVAQ